MAVVPEFTKFKIEGLRGHIDIEAKILNNTLIMVGENGSGKTTFLRIMFYFLSGRWSMLSQFNFRKITAVINGKEYAIELNKIQKALQPLDDGVIGLLPTPIRRRVIELNRTGRNIEAEAVINNYVITYGISKSKQRSLNFGKSDDFAKNLFDLHENITSTLGAQILYLPTYRRIERELSSIIQGFDQSESYKQSSVVRQAEDGPDYVELVEFGMKDVKKAIDSTLEDIRNFQLHGTTQLSLSYLGDVVSQSYKSTDSDVIANVSKDTIDAVLNRIDDAILSSDHKAHLRAIVISANTSSNVPSEHERIIYHYFAKLVKFQGELQVKEANIKLFCELCSVYITDKKFVYESGKFSFKIEPTHQHNSKDSPILLSDLSSGEKQIVSLFSHLYLSGRDKFFVLIDEPELSLSVPWQRRFLLDIRDASFCTGLVAVTHSPFIYDNKLREYTHSLGEFVSGPDWGNI